MLDDDAPGLHSDFIIDTGGSEENLIRLAAIHKSVEAKILAGSTAIERASSNMVDVKAATANLRAFGASAEREMKVATAAIGQVGNTAAGLEAIFGRPLTFATNAPAATRELAATAREVNKTEKEIDKLVFTLDRETAALGKTREEQRASRIEELALAAAAQDNTDASDRLLTSVRALDAARRGVAETKLAAQMEAEAAAARAAATAEGLLIAQLREREQLQAALARTSGTNRPRATDAGATYSALAARAAEEEAEAIRKAAYAHDMYEAKVREGAEAMRVAAAAEQQLAADARTVRAALDPMFLAQEKFDNELTRADRLLAAGTLSQREYAQEVQRAREALHAHARSVAGSVDGTDKLNDASERLGVMQRFTAGEVLNLSRQFQDIGVTAAMGMNPLMILVQQGPQIYDVLEQAKIRGVSAGAALRQMGSDVMTYGVAGFSRLMALATPTNLLLGGTAVAAIAVVRALGTYGAAMQRFEVTAAGLGRVSGQTAQQLEDISEAAAASGERSLGATRDSVAAFAAAGLQGGATISLLAANVERYGKLTGQDLPAAQAALAEAMSDPAQAADTFTQQLGLLTGAQYEHIKQLAAQGDQEQATAELTRILTGDLAANADQATGVAKVMNVLGGAVSGVATMFGRLDQRIRDAAASYDAWLKQRAGGWAVDLFGTGNKAPASANPNAGRNQDQIAALNASQTLNTGGMKQYNDLLAQQRILQKGLANTTGLTAAQVQGLRHDYAAVTDTINVNRNASGQWITTQERAHLVAQAQAKLAAAHTQTDKAAAQRTISRLQLGTQVLTQQERETQALDAYNRVSNKYVKPKVDHHAETLAREAEAMEAQIGNLYKLGDAYGVSGAAALIAEARVKAESAAIKNRGDVDAAVARQVRLAIADRVRGADQSTAAMVNQAAMQEQVNAVVAAGNVPAERAGELLRDRMADLPLLAAIEAAKLTKDAQGLQKATAALDDQRAARDRLTDAERRAQMLAAIASGKDRLAELAEEKRLIGATDMERVRALATLKATQQAAANGWTGTDAAKWINDQVAIATGTEQNRQAQDAYNASLSATSTLFDAIDQSAQRAAQGMTDAFGHVGTAIGNALTVMTGYYADQARLQEAHKTALREAGDDQAQIDRQNRLFSIRNSSLQIGAYGDMAAAAKGFFKEGSAGYDALAGAEKAFRLVQFALSARAIAQDAIETGSKIANSVARTAVGATEAVVNAIKSLPFPLNIAAGAATIAALASIGVGIAGSFGGGSKKPEPSNTGTGTVLGDPDAKSESLKRSIDALHEVDTTTSVFARQMAGSLRSIDNQIGGLASVLVRSGNIDASAGVETGFKTNAVGSVLKAIVPVFGSALASLFGTKTTVVGSGLFGGAQSVGDILSGGFDASTYLDVQKKKKLFGITTSTKYSTQYGDADAGLENQFTLILKSFATAIDSAAGPLGEATGAVEARLNGFVVNLGKIDLQGLTGTEIQEKLEAVFGAAADGMAEAAFPGIARFQKAGEGAFETLVRVSSTLEAVSTSLDLLGTSAQKMSIDAKLGLADQFDSVGDLTSAVDAYFTGYYSKTEQAAAKTAQMGRVFDSLGLTMPATLTSFRQLVEAQDLATAAGQSTYATLLQLAPAFADLQEALSGAKSAADIASERQDLERQLLELRGDTAAIRAQQLAKLDASNRELQEQIYAIQDAQEAIKAAEALATAWTSVGDSVMDEVKRIRGLTDAAGGNSFAALMGRFNATTTAARGGDQDAAKSLPALSQALLTAAAEQATSRQELARVQAQTAASLEATYGVVTALAKGRTATAATEQVTAAAQSAGTARTDDNPADLRAGLDALRNELEGMRRDMNAGTAMIAGNTSRIDRKLEAVASASGGEAISVIGVAA